MDAALQCIIQMAAAPALQVLPFELPFACNGPPAFSCHSIVLPCSICYAADCCCLVSGAMKWLPSHLTMLQLRLGSMHSVFACAQDQWHVHHLDETVCSPLGAINSMCLSLCYA